MATDKVLYVLTTKGGLSEEQAKALIKKGIADVRALREAPVEVLKGAGLKTAAINKLKAAAGK